MKEDFVSYDIAVKLDEKGFNNPCVAHFRNERLCYNSISVHGEDEYIDYNIIIDVRDLQRRTGLLAPTISQVLKWLRETKNIEVVASFSYRNKVWGYQVGDMTLLEDSILSYDYSFPTYEEAALAGIEYVLNNLI